MSLCLGEDTYPKLVIGADTLTNVRVTGVSPAHVILAHDKGIQTVKLQELPEPLKSKYPYDAEKAAAYEKQKDQERRVTQLQNAASVRASLLAKEGEIRSRLQSLETERARVNKDISLQQSIQKGKGNKSPEHQEMVRLKTKKRDILEQIRKSEDELKKVEAQRRKFE